MATRQFSGTIPVGTRVFGPFAIGDALDALHVRVSNWPQTNRTVGIDVEQSSDGGQTWAYVGGMNPTPGGRSVGRDGTADASFNVGPLEDGTGRQLRATATVAGGSVTTTITITTS